jgi:SAM-dependent methyltransferase
MSPLKVRPRLTGPDLASGSTGVVAASVRRLQWSIRKHGLAGAATRLARLILMPQWRMQNAQQYQAWLAFARERDGDFDQKHGVDTSGIVRLRELSVVGQHWTSGIDYQGVSAGLFDEMIGQLNIQHEQYGFVDLGSGKGRALLLAAAHPFRQIVGVEFSKELTAIAQRNINRYKGPRVCNRIEVVNSDAADYELPASPLIVFMYDPFNESVMNLVVLNIIRAALGSALPSYVIYCTPRLRQLLDVRLGKVFMESSAGDDYVIYQVQSPSSVGHSDSD